MMIFFLVWRGRELGNLSFLLGEVCCVLLRGKFWV